MMTNTVELSKGNGTIKVTISTTDGLWLKVNVNGKDRGSSQFVTKMPAPRNGCTHVICNVGLTPEEAVLVEGLKMKQDPKAKKIAECREAFLEAVEDFRAAERACDHVAATKAEVRMDATQKALEAAKAE